MKMTFKRGMIVAAAMAMILAVSGGVLAEENAAPAAGNDALKISTPAEAAASAAAANLKTDQDKISYIIGSQIGQGLKAQGIDVNLEVLGMAMKDALEGKPSAISEDEAQKIMMEFGQKKRAEMQAKQDAENLQKIGKDNEWKMKLQKPELMTFDANTDYFWVLETSKGTIKVKLMPTVAPMHVTSTIFLTKKGFYDGLTFHRIIPGFMAQGGCPVGNGTGGPGYKYDGEIKPDVKHDKPYLLSMANAGPGTDGSQFFLTFKATPWLDGKHTIFGEITEGQDVMTAIEKVGSQSGKPQEEVKIIKATIEEVKK